MEKQKFKRVALFEKNTKWDCAITRQKSLPQRPKDIRSEFARDVTRLLHCTAYRRLKHKTQVFFAPQNDHICTRIEHVNYVASISHTIGKYLGLNTELIHAIALGHDLGHAPFGHAGEYIIKDIVKKELDLNFWHEKNSLYFIDKIETLEDPEGKQRNLNLTYAVRDGIVCHCGEIEENGLFPREEYIDLDSMNKASQYAPFTYEGCVVKISDKIAYLGRDIEDALTLKILSRSELKELRGIIKGVGGTSIKEVNNTIVIHNFIIDLCENSSPEVGIKISEANFKAMNALKEFNYNHIYFHKRLEAYKSYAKLIITSIFKLLKELYDRDNTIKNLKRYELVYPLLITTFVEWLEKYAEPNKRSHPGNRYENQIIYDLFNQRDCLRAIVDFISGMTDTFAKRVFDEIITF